MKSRVRSYFNQAVSPGVMITVFTILMIVPCSLSARPQVGPISPSARPQAGPISQSAETIKPDIWIEHVIPQRDIVLRLNQGSMAFNTFSTLSVDKHQRVELLLSPSLSINKLKDQFWQQTGISDVVTNRLHVSDKMEAKLVGSAGLDVKSLTSDAQPILPQKVTHWMWEVTPLKEGQASLNLILSAFVIDTTGESTPMAVKSYQHDVQAELSLTRHVTGFIGKNWQWLWAAILVPVGGYLWNRRRKKPAKP